MAIWIKPAGGVEPARLVAKDAGILRGWTPDGKAVITVRNTQGTGDIWLVPIDGGSSRPLVETPFHETDARFSPDGRWLAYTSDENNERGRAGQVDVFVQPYPPNGQRWRATPNGGHDPNWSSDSRELYFTSGAVPRSAAESVFAVPVLSGEPRFGLPKLVLENAVTSVRQSPRYAVSPDGRFLLIAPLQSEAVEQEPQPLTVLLNWPELVRKN
jgi:Tol biopolymer transport system component